MKILIIILLYLCSVSATNVYCTGHDACRNKVWNGEYNIYCGASNSERTCRSTTLNCGEDNDCTIKTQGSGHDAYQDSVVNAKDSNSFKLTCAASGFRDCKDITIWCPQKTGTTCECSGCPSSVVMKCVSGISCSSTGSATTAYVESEYTMTTPSPSSSINGYVPELHDDNCCQHNSNVDNELTLMCKTCAYNLFNKGNHGTTYRYYSNDNILYQITCDDDSFNSVVCYGENKIIGTTSTYQGSCNDSCIDRYNNIPGRNRAWRRDSMHTGMRPDCPKVIISNNNNYLWNTLELCKRKCVMEESGKCNMLSRFGDISKAASSPYHCRFYACSDPFNFTWVQQTQWGNYANEANTYIIPIRKYQPNTCTNIVNKTNYIVRYINLTRYINHTRYIYLTRYINHTIYIINQINLTRYVNHTNYPGVSVSSNDNHDSFDTAFINNKNNTLKCDNDRSLMDKVFMYGFFTNIVINILLIACCWLKCNNIIRKNNSNNNLSLEMTSRRVSDYNPPLAEVAPIARPVDNTPPKIETHAIEINNNIIMEEEVKTPGGTTIRRRAIQI